MPLNTQLPADNYFCAAGTISGLQKTMITIEYYSALPSTKLPDSHPQVLPEVSQRIRKSQQKHSGPSKPELHKTH
jgi:hypothetical protein